MRYFIIAGEQSGDLHGSNLVRELLRKDTEAVISCWGGDMMQSAGAELLMHYRRTAFMGFVEVAKNLGSIRKLFSLCRQQITSFKPDTVILIDYPGFNLRIAEFAKKSGLKVFYYISPKLWAWNEGRVKKVKKYVDRMYIIFPFEVDFYMKHGVEAVYMGNPLLDETAKRLRAIPAESEIRKSLGLEEKPVIAMLAGSRKSEVRQILPRMLKVVQDFPGYQFVLAGVKNLPEDLYNGIIKDYPVKLVRDKTYEILYISEAALVKSGTATLEAALIGVPEVVCYRGDFISMIIAWTLVKVKYISLVNLIAGYEAVRELIQYSLNRKNLVHELKALLPGGSKREKVLRDYARVKQILGPEGASERVASDMVQVLKQGGV
ncbi:MAG: lipid-A-disaccharide synthase [Bacteroidales bacterium]|nr:lipid-A-disaccharide synthase [Bacteroidales bacterium]